MSPSERLNLVICGRYVLPPPSTPHSLPSPPRPVGKAVRAFSVFRRSGEQSGRVSIQNRGGVTWKFFSSRIAAANDGATRGKIQLRLQERELAGNFCGIPIRYESKRYFIDSLRADMHS